MPSINLPTKSYTVTFNNSYNASTTSSSSTSAFDGYYTSSNGGGTQYYASNGASLRAWDQFSDDRLYANWGSGNNVTLPLLVRQGYTFGGWYSNASLTNFVGNNGLVYEVATSHTLYAKWYMNPAQPDLFASNDTGASNTDNITNDTTPSFTGTVADNAIVKAYIDGNYEGEVTATDSGIWTYTVSSQSDGNHTIKVKATYNNGNYESDDSSVLNYTIDSSAPSAPSVPNLNTANDTGASDSDNITSDTTPTFSGTAEAGTTVDIIINGVVDGTTSVNGSGVWSYTTGVLNDGAYTITAKAIDTAGNQSPASSSLAVTIDGTNPTVTATATSLSIDSVRLTVVATDANTLEYAYSVGGATYGSYTANAEHDFTNLDTNSSHIFFVKTRDIAGNELVNNDTIATLAEVPEFASHTSNEDGSVELVIDQGTNPDATSYYMEIASSNDFSDAVMLVDWTNPEANTFLIPKADLSQGAVQYIRVKARNSEMIETSYNTVGPYSIQSVPEIPSQPTITINSVSEIEISWPEVVEADNYILYDQGIQVTETTELSYIHNTLNTNTEHVYTLKSKNEAGTSIASASKGNYTFSAIPEIRELISIPDGSVNIYVNQKTNPDTTEYRIEGSTNIDFSNF